MSPSPQRSKGKLLRLHFCESDRYQGKPLHEAILARCREMKIAGATVLRGLEGYGEVAEIRRHHLVTHEQPMVVLIVDSVENIDALRPALEDMLPSGLVAVSEVEMIRVQHGFAPA